MTSDLAPIETARLAELETVVERNVRGFVETGAALGEIRERRLYRATHATFEAYCRERWDFTRQRGNQLVDAAEMTTVVVTLGLPAPTSERQARELAPLKDDPERVRETWEEVVATHGASATAADVRAAVKRRRPLPADGKVIVGKRGLSHDPAVVDWVRERSAEGWTREQIVEASARGGHGWPRPDQRLTNGGVSECRAVIAHLERNGQPPTLPKRRRVTASLVDKQAERVRRDKLALDVVRALVGSALELRRAREHVVAALGREWRDDPYGVIAVLGNLSEVKNWLDEVIEPGMGLLDDEGRRQVKARAARG